MANAFGDNVYRGLNVAKSLSDISDRDIALSNLGLRRDNLNLIKGLGGLITTQEFHNISGLIDDQKRVLDSLEASSVAAGEISDSIRSVANDQRYNFAINSKLIAGTIKYNYVNFDGNDGSGNSQWNLKSADISTSRVSSWSPFGPEDNPDQLITYNSEVINSGEFLALTELALTTQPQQKAKRSQVPTDKLTLNINGTDVQFPVMRGIPFRFTAGGATLEFNAHLIESGGDLIEDFLGYIPVEFEKTNLDGVTTIPISNNNTSEFVPNKSANGTSEYHVQASIDNASVSGNVYLDVFYNPSLISKLRLRNNNLTSFAETVFTGLEDLDISNNKFENIPNFNFIAPNLKHIDLSNNKLGRAPNSAEVAELQYITGYTGTPNEQLARLPLSMETINDLGSWEDLPGNLDISYERFPDLVNLDFGEISFPGSTTNLQTGGDGVAPAVYDPNYKLKFDPTDSNVLDPSTGEFTFVAHRFVSGDKVRYKNRVAPDNPNFVMGGGNVGTGGQDSTMLAGTLCEELSPLSRNDILQVEVVDLNTIKLRQSPYGAGNVISSYTLAADTGTFHTFEKWDDVNNKLHIEAGRGVEIYNPDYVDYRFVPVAYLNSTNLIQWGPSNSTSAENRAFRTDCIADYRFVDTTNSTTMDISNEDRKFKFENKAGLEILGLSGCKTHVPNIHDMPNLKYLSLGPNTSIGFGYRVEDRELSQQNVFGGLNTTTKLETMNISMSSSNNANASANGRSTDLDKTMWGDATTLLHGQTELQTLEYGPAAYARLNLDGNFLKDCSKLRRFDFYDVQRTGSSRSVYLYREVLNYDQFAVDGSTSARQGNILPDQTGSDPRLCVVEFNGSAGSGYLINETVQPPINALKFETWNPNPTGTQSTDCVIIVSGCHLHGRFPNLSGCEKMQKVTISSLRCLVDPNQSITPGKNYQVAENMDIAVPRSDFVQGWRPAGFISSKRNHSMSFQEYEDMGWSGSDVNSDFVSWGDNTSRGTLVAGGSTGKPKQEDWFEYQDPDINTCIHGQEYVIVDPSGSTKAQWEAMGWVANYIPSAGASEWGHYVTGNNPAKGDTFKASGDANRIFLTGCVAGGNYLFIRSGTSSNLSTIQGMDSTISGVDDTDWKQEFNPTSTTSSYTADNNGTVVMKRTGVAGNTDPAVDYGTGKVVRDRCVQPVRSQGLSEFITDTNNEIKDMEKLRNVTVRITNMEGDFPVFSQSSDEFVTLQVTDNKFSGPLPDINGVNSCESYKVNDNLFDGYTSGSLSTAVYCKQFYMNDNKLNDYHLGPIINDLYLNSNARSSNSNITVRLYNQTPDSGNRLNLSWLQQAGNSAINDKYTVLVQRGWSFQLDQLP